MNLPIRYSASGPIIENSSGGQATPGDGFTLRFVEEKATSGATVLTSTDAVIEDSSAEFVLAMPNPDPNLRYAAELDCGVAPSATGVGFEISVEWSPDGGATWTPQQNTRWQIATTASAVFAFHYKSIMIFGGDLLDPVLPSSTELQARFIARLNPGTGTIAAGQLFGRIWEML